MIKKRITYTDYNGNQRTEDFWFNINQAEAAEMEMSVDGGISNMIRRIIDSNNTPSIIKIFKELILKAYGEKSPDGRQFMKSGEISRAFSETEAYSILFMELATNAEAAAAFVKGVLSSVDKLPRSTEDPEPGLPSAEPK